MPRGVPKNGFRKTRKRQEALVPVVFAIETDEQIRQRISLRFDIMKEMIEAAAEGGLRSLIISGPPGVGKSYETDKALIETGAEHEFVKGLVKATGLYRLLWKHRTAGSVLVFDDADSVFYDDTSLNFLKAVCDSSDRRNVSYRAEYDMEDEDGEVIPRSFDFEGTIIFLTNLDFDDMMDRGHKLAPHLEALVSRSHYIDLSMKSKQDYLVRIKMVVASGMLEEYGLTLIEINEVLWFIQQHADTLRELSLRMVMKIAALRKARPSWEQIAIITCCRN